MPDIDLSSIEVNVSDEAIIVSADVEDREATDLIRRAKVRLHVLKTVPFRLLGPREPRLQGALR